MDHAAVVGGLERVGDLLANPDGLLDRQRPALQAIRESLALDPLEDQVAGGVRRLLEAVNRGDVGMIERRQQLGLALETRELLGVASHLGGQGLDRHSPVELAIAGEVHHAHATAAQLALDDVVAQLFGRGAVSGALRVCARAHWDSRGPRPPWARHSKCRSD